MKIIFEAIATVFRELWDCRLEIKRLRLEISKLKSLKEPNLEFEFFKKHKEGIFEYYRVSKIEEIIENITNEKEYSNSMKVGENYYDLKGKLISGQIICTFCFPVIGRKDNWNGWVVLVKKEINYDDFLIFCEALAKLDNVQFDELQKFSKFRRFWEVKGILFPSEK